MPQVVALRDALDRAGLIAVKRIEQSGPGGGPIKTETVNRDPPAPPTVAEAKEILRILRDSAVMEALLDEDGDKKPE